MLLSQDCLQPFSRIRLGRMNLSNTVTHNRLAYHWVVHIHPPESWNLPVKSLCRSLERTAASHTPHPLCSHSRSGPFVTQMYDWTLCNIPKVNIHEGKSTKIWQTTSNYSLPSSNTANIRAINNFILFFFVCNVLLATWKCLFSILVYTTEKSSSGMLQNIKGENF